MPVVVACPKCKKKYSLPEKMLGKSVKCTKCETKFRTPAAKAGGAKVAKAAGTKPQAAKAQAESNKLASEMRNLGIDGPIHREPDIFAGATRSRPGEVDPLANHVVGDPGFSELDQQFVEEEEVAVNPLADMYANPALQQEKVGSKSRPKTDDEPTGKKGKRKRKRKSKGKGSFLDNAWIWILAIFLPLFGLAAVLGFVAPGIGIIVSMIGFVTFSIVALAVAIWMLISTYNVEESVVHVLLTLFVPFYAIYFLIVHWKNGMRNSGMALIAQIAVQVVGFIALFINIFALAAKQAAEEAAQASVITVPWTEAANVIATHLFLC